MLIEVVTQFREGNIDRAADAFYRYVPLMRFELQEGIGVAIRKEVLRRRGAPACAAIRAPGTKLDPLTSAAPDRLLEGMKTQQRQSGLQRSPGAAKAARTCTLAPSGQGPLLLNERAGGLPWKRPASRSVPRASNARYRVY
ncbi:MAG TPA: hypothetical protein VJN89_04360 [Candidatus Acidoferrum sp.]|nr:hypothetical protein [Candidatus Acidoferrum sp.]